MHTFKHVHCRSCWPECTPACQRQTQVLPTAEKIFEALSLMIEFWDPCIWAKKPKTCLMGRVDPS